MSAHDEYSIGIYDILKQIETIVEESPKPTFGGNDKRIVSIGDIRELIADVRTVIAEDIRRANGVLIQADKIVEGAETQADMVAKASENQAQEILNQAQQQANQIISEARKRAVEIQDAAKDKYEELISESNIYKEAQRRATILKQKSESSARIVYNDSLVYADDIMKEVARMLASCEKQLALTRKTLENNRSELNQSMIPEATRPVAPEQTQQVKRQAKPQAKPQPQKQAKQAPVEDIYEEQEEVKPSVIIDEPEPILEEEATPEPKKASIFSKFKNLLVGKDDGIDDDDDFDDDDDSDY